MGGEREGGFKVLGRAGRLVLLFNATLAVFALTLAPSAFSTYGIIDKYSMYVTGGDLTVSFTPRLRTVKAERLPVCKFNE